MWFESQQQHVGKPYCFDIRGFFHSAIHLVMWIDLPRVSPPLPTFNKILDKSNIFDLENKPPLILFILQKDNILIYYNNFNIPEVKIT